MESVETKVKTIEAFTWIDFCTYFLLFCFAVRNVITYLVVQKRWNMFYLTVFYVFVVLLSCSRTIYFFVFGYLLHDFDNNYSITLDKLLITSSELSFSLKAIIGTFQVGQMLDLTVEMKSSVMILTEARSKTYKTVIKVATSIVATFLLIAIGINLIYSFRWPDWSDKEIPPSIIRFYYYYTPCVLTSLSVLLTISTIYLLVLVNRHFKQVLKAEACKVRTIYVVFTIAYISRAITSLIFSLKPPHSMNEFTHGMTYLVMYNFWDVLPLSLIMSYHYSGFKTDNG